MVEPIDATVVLADDQAIVREGIASLCRDHGIQVLGQAGTGQDFDQDAVRIQAVWELFEQFDTNLGCFDLLAAPKERAGQKDFHFDTRAVFTKDGFDLGDGLLVLPTLGIHLSQGTACQADLGRLEAVTPAV